MSASSWLLTNCFAVGGHVLARFSHLIFKGDPGKRTGRDTRAGGAAALADGAVAGVTLVFHVSFITVFRRTPRRLSRRWGLRQCDAGREQYE